MWLERDMAEETTRMETPAEGKSITRWPDAIKRILQTGLELRKIEESGQHLRRLMSAVDVERVIDNMLIIKLNAVIT